VTDLSGQLDADWARSDQQDPIRLCERSMRFTNLLLGMVGPLHRSPAFPPITVAG
jgi:hypothetical protein